MIAKTPYLSQKHPVWGPARGYACGPSVVYAALKILGINTVTPQAILKYLEPCSPGLYECKGISARSIQETLKRFGAKTEVKSFLSNEVNYTWPWLLELSETNKLGILFQNTHCVLVIYSSQGITKLWDPDFNEPLPRLTNRHTLISNWLNSHSNTYLAISAWV